MTPFPEILAPTDLPPPDSSEFWHVLPCGASTIRDRKRNSITLNTNSTRASNEPSTKVLRRPKLPQNGDKVPNFVVFLHNFDNKGRKVCRKVSLYKNCQRQSCSAINCLSSGINTLCLKKRPTFTICYSFYIHSSIATIFGTNVAEKVGNQNILYFPTTPN